MDRFEAREAEETTSDSMMDDTIDIAASRIKSLNDCRENYPDYGGSSIETRLVNETVPEKKLKPVLCALVICLGSLSMGAIVAYPSPAVPDMNKCCDNPFHLTEDQASWVGSIITLAALVGGLVGGIWMDKVGRRLALMLTSVPLTFGWIAVIVAPNYEVLLLGRFLTGLGMGMISVICPVYIGEISPSSIRGILGSCHQLFCCFGIVYAYTLGYFLSWQWLAVACLSFVPVMILGLSQIIDSPRYLYSKNKRETCKSALIWLRGNDCDINRDMMELELSLQKSKNQARLREYLQPQLWKPLAVSLGLMIFQQTSGINIVMFYTVKIFTMAQIDMDANVQTIIVGIVGVIGTTVTVLVSDILGRKVLLIASAALMVLSMTGLGAFFYVLIVVNLNVTPENLTWLPVASLVLFNFGFNVAYGPIPWLMMGELFPLKSKAASSSVATAVNWFFAFLITKFWVNLVDAVGPYGGYWFCAGFCLLSILFIIAFVPETKGKSLEEIEKLFN